MLCKSWCNMYAKHHESKPLCSSVVLGPHTLLRLSAFVSVSSLLLFTSPVAVPVVCIVSVRKSLAKYHT